MAVDFDATVVAACLGVFGEAVLFLPAAGGSYALQGVFDDGYRRDVLLAEGIGIANDAPQLGIRAADWPVFPAQGDRVQVTRTGLTYSIADVRPDGHGHVRLLLSIGDGTGA